MEKRNRDLAVKKGRDSANRVGSLSQGKRRERNIGSFRPKKEKDLKRWKIQG